MSSAIPSTIRAWTRPSRGPVRTHLHLNTIPAPAAPTANSATVLIRVSHVALNFSSEEVMATIPGLPFADAMTPELELSGVVVAAGGKAPASVREPGTRVIAFQSIPELTKGRGVLREMVALPGTQVVPLPEGMSMVHASGLIGAGATALKMVRSAGLKSGDRVLVNGASGSVGSVLVQICKERGAVVVGVASGGNEEIVRGFGADEFVDYRVHDPLPAYLAECYGSRQFDHVFDCVGTQALFTNSPKYLKPTGTLVNIGALESGPKQFWYWFLNVWLPTSLGGTPRRYIMFSTPPTVEAALELCKLVEDGKVRVPIDSVWDMEDVRKAYEKLATKRAKGKIVIKIQDI